MEIWKEKQFIYILREGAKKPYVLDLAQGHFIGLNGLPLKRVSTVLQNECWSYERRANTFLGKAVAHFIYNLQYIMGDYVSHCSNLKYYKVFNNLLSISNENAYLIMSANSYNICYIADVLNEKCRGIFYKEYSQGKIDCAHFNPRDYMREVALRDVQVYFDKTYAHFTEEEKQEICSFYANTDKETFELFFYLMERHWHSLWGMRDVERIASYYMGMCKDLEIKPKKEKDFVAEFARVKNMRTARAMEISDKKIQNYLLPLKHKLAFEDDNFVVVVPMTKQEFLDEGESQNNCVARMYLPKVEHQDRIIVFIRKKEDVSKSYITCEIYPDSFRIGQYLTKCNNYVTDENALSFREKYQEHLLSVLNK